MSLERKRSTRFCLVAYYIKREWQVVHQSISDSTESMRCFLKTLESLVVRNEIVVGLIEDMRTIRVNRVSPD